MLREFLVTVAGKRWPVAGTAVERGSLQRRLSARLTRDGAVLYEGDVLSMRVEARDVNSAGAGEEVGIVLPNRDLRFAKVPSRPPSPNGNTSQRVGEQGDVIESLETVQEKQAIDWFPEGFT